MSAYPIWIVIILSLCGANVLGLQQDIVFMLDTSDGYSDTDLDQVVDFVYNFTYHLSVAPDAAFVSVLTYSADVTENFDLDEHQSDEKLLTAITSLKPLAPNGAADTFDAVQFAKEKSFTTAHGVRENSTKLAFLISNSRSSSPTQSKFIANSLKKTVDIYVIGIKSDELEEDQAELVNIASDPVEEYYYYIDSVTDLCGLLATLLPIIEAPKTVSSDYCIGKPADSGEEGLLTDGQLAAVVSSAIGVTLLTIVTVWLVCKYKKSSQSKTLELGKGCDENEHVSDEFKTDSSGDDLQSSRVFLPRRDSSGLTQTNQMPRTPTGFTLATLNSYIKEPTNDINVVDVTPDTSVQNNHIGNGHIGNGHVTSGYRKGSTPSLSNTIRNELEQTTDYSSNGGSTPTVSDGDKKSSAGSKRKLNIFKSSLNKVDIL